MPVCTAEDALLVFGKYLIRWGKEEGYRFCKSFLNIENILVRDFDAISNMAWVTHLVYFWVTLFYKSDPEKIEQLASEKLIHFKTVTEIKYKYYRVAQLMRIFLWKNHNMEVPLMLTEFA